MDPMGHEHRFEGEIVPTVDADYRCRRCGHQTTPHFVETVFAAGVLPAITDVQIEVRIDDPLEIKTLASGVSEYLPGPAIALLNLVTTAGARQVMLDDTELKEAEKYAASGQDLRVFAKWVLARRGIVL